MDVAAPARISILDCVPGSIKLRAQQIAALLWLEANYDKYKFLCLTMPVGAGKSWVVTTFNNWIIKNGLGRCADLTPTKLLQDQYTKDFDWIPDLKGLNNYTCASTGGQGSCADWKRMSHDGKVCDFSKCEYIAARNRVTAADAAIYNFHSYHYAKAAGNKSHLIIDEGHNTRNFLEDLYTIVLWSCELGFDNTQPLDPKSVLELVKAALGKANTELTEAIARKIADNAIEDLEEFVKKLTSVAAGLEFFGEDILITPREEKYPRKRWLKRDMSKFKDQLQYQIRIKPLRINKIAEKHLWKDSVRKVLFLSATIGKLDMEELGIKPEDVAYFESDSPIPAEQRKFVVWPKASMNYKNQEASLPEIVKCIEKIAAMNADHKGVIHCTYAISNKLKNLLKSDRYLFHNDVNKNDTYYKFRASKQPKILIACGMAEGIDLPDDLARFQIILKVQYPSLADEVWAWKMKNNAKAYLWETVKTIIQQSGRICRGPQDRGFTYILDAEFLNLWNRTKSLGFWPAWFCEALVWVTVKEN